MVAAVAVGTHGLGAVGLSMIPLDLLLTVDVDKALAAELRENEQVVTSEAVR